MGRGALELGAPEYNCDTDPQAAREVFGQPELAITQFPLETYRRCAYSVAELEHDLGGAGRVGAWLWQRFLELPIPDFVQLGEVWPLGDSPAVLVTAFGEESSLSVLSAEPGHAARRVYTNVDVRLLVADPLARLRLHERRQVG